MNSWVDIAVIVAYLVGTTVFGCSFYFRNGSGDANTFMAGGGRIPGWVLALSIFATYVSSISFLALPAKAYLSNWNVLVLSFSIPIAAGVAAVWFVPFYRRMTGVSAYSFLEDRFGFWSRAYASGCFLLMQGVRSGMILFLLALLLKALLGFSIPIVILVVGASTVVYSMLGGLQAVVWTDAVQAILLIGGALLCLVVLGCTLPDGLAAGLKTAFDADKFSLGSFSVSEWGSETFWVTFAYGVFLNLQNFGIDQSYTQRYVAAKSEKEAVRSMFSGAMLYLPVSLVFVAIGTLLWVWVNGHPGVVPDDVLAKSDAVFPWFIVNRLPKGITGLLVAAIIAAAMSTVSATLNSGATVLLEDYRKRFAKTPVPPGSQIRFLRGTTVALGVFSICVALAVMNVTSVLTTWWAVQSVISGGMLGLFLLGAFARRTGKVHAAVATVLGIVVVVWIVIGQSLTFGRSLVHVNLAIVLGTVAIVFTGGLLSRRRIAAVLVLAAVVNASAGDTLPPLVGDGVSDDTAAIQALIDTGRSCVALPPPKNHYVISKTLFIDSGQELRLDRFTRIRLEKGSDCFMLANRNRESGDRRIALTGGIWDFDNVSQSPNPQQAHKCKPPVKVSLPKSYDPDFFMGILMSFMAVDDLQIRHVTFRNPGSYCCQLAGVSNFRVDDVTFDFDKWNPIRLNMDGIHLDGDCHHGRITDLFGTCFDDLVAINANDGFCSPREAPITDIEVDGIHAEYCHSAVRILSAGAEIRRISIRNVFGNFYTYAVGLTHFFPQKPRGTFEDIVIENLFAAKAFAPEDIGVRSRVQYPLVWFQGPVDAGSVTIRNFSRTEKTVPVASIRIDNDATVRRLTVRDCRMANALKEPMYFIENRGRVGTLVCENNDFSGEWRGCDEEVRGPASVGGVRVDSAVKSEE